jgi:hypothetical protein
VAQDLAKHLVRHGHIRLAPHMIPELRLDHAEGTLNVGPLMVVLQELLAVEGEVMEHLLPQPPGCPAVDTLERNVWVAPWLAMMFVLFTLE